MVDSRVTVYSSRIDPSKLIPGDHIYSWRRRIGWLISHHGIYESDSKVIHFADSSNRGVGGSRFSSSSSTQTCSKCAEKMRKGGVIITCLDCFLEGGNLHLFVYGVPGWFRRMSNFRPIQATCSEQPEDSPKTVLGRANGYGRDGFGSYCYKDNNCMHFAFYCKTGHYKTNNRCFGEEITE